MIIKQLFGEHLPDAIAIKWIPTRHLTDVKHTKLKEKFNMNENATTRKPVIERLNGAKNRNFRLLLLNYLISLVSFARINAHRNS